MDLNLDTLKREILEYLDASGFAVFHSSPGGLDGQPMVLWDTERHPDYQMFLEVARKSDARVIIFASREFQASDTEDLLAQLDDLDLERDDKREYEKRLHDLSAHEGVTCMLELAFDYQQRLYVYEMQPDWYDDFLNVEDEIMSLIAGHDDMNDDSEPLGGYFSKN